MEILELYPQDSLTNDIVSKFNFSTKTTIYNRINFLKKIELVENVGIDIYDEDIRSKKINLTSNGLELLASLYLSLEMSLNAEKGI